MADMLDKVIDTAKKLRKAAKKIEDPDVKDLICELTLSLADLKMHTAELREEGLRLSQELQEAQESVDSRAKPVGAFPEASPATSPTAGSGSWPQQH